MLTYWETLIAKKSNITVSDSYAVLWGTKSQNGYTVETYTGTLPATLTDTKAGYLESYRIYGNAVQDGTPTPENPIVPSGCGELEITGAHAGQYKLPLTVNGVEYPIFLGEAETTRYIKKLVLTGEETINGISNTPYGATKAIAYLYSALGMTDIIDFDQLMTYYPYPSYYSTHFVTKNHGQNLWTDINDGEMGANGRSSNNRNRYLIFGTSHQTEAEFKQFLAAQYANGTPVTVWYRLAEPETAVVNEPLMKIGDYADTIDSTQSTVRIPTAAGETTISWAGEGLAPSEVEFVYKVKG